MNDTQFLNARLGKYTVVFACLPAYLLACLFAWLIFTQNVWFSGRVTDVNLQVPVFFIAGLSTANPAATSVTLRQTNRQLWGENFGNKKERLRVRISVLRSLETKAESGTFDLKVQYLKNVSHEQAPRVVAVSCV